MEVRKMRQVGQVAAAGAVMSLVSTPAFAQGMDFVEMFEQMGPVAWGVAIVLFIM